MIIYIYNNYRFHEFEWHGQDQENIGKLRPGGHQFTKLQMIPSQIYYDVRDNLIYGTETSRNSRYLNYAIVPFRNSV